MDAEKRDGNTKIYSIEIVVLDVLALFFSSLLTPALFLFYINGSIKSSSRNGCKKGKTIIVMSGDERVSIVQ